MKEIEEIKIHSTSVAAKALREGKWEEYEAWMAEVEADASAWDQADMAEAKVGSDKDYEELIGTGSTGLRVWHEGRDDRKGDEADQWLKAHGG